MSFNIHSQVIIYINVEAGNLRISYWNERAYVSLKQKNNINKTMTNINDILINKKVNNNSFYLFILVSCR